MGDAAAGPKQPARPTGRSPQPGTVIVGTACYRIWCAAWYRFRMDSGISYPSFMQLIPGVHEIVALRAIDEEVTPAECDGRAEMGFKPVRFVHLSVAELEAFECTALLLSYLLVPGPEAQKARISIYRVICYWAAREGWVWPRQRRDYVFQNEARIKTAMARIHRFIRRREAAFLMTFPLLLQEAARVARSDEANAGDLARLVDLPLLTETRLEAAASVTHIAMESEAKNVLYRVWGVSLPVLGLAFAAFTMSLDCNRNLLKLVSKDDSADNLLVKAESCCQIMRLTPGLTDAWERRIRFSKG
jgi:hypothetical protein